MENRTWVKTVMRLGAVIALCLVWLPVSPKASAGELALASGLAGAHGRPPLPDRSPASAAPTVAGDELWSAQFELGVGSVVDWVFAAVYAPNGDLYVGGDFTHIAGVSANYVAYWNASSNRWSALGLGVNNRVSALAFYGSTLYVGGYFNYAGSAPASAVASYDVGAHTWSNMNGGMDHAITGADVYALAVDGSGNLYAGGQFDTAGGVHAQNIAKWNGSSWSALSFGIGTTNDSVEALAVSGSDVYAGGTFTSPGQNIAHFNGVTWSSLGAGTSDDVLALAINGSSLYVGGSFTTVNSGALTVNYVALWNTGASSWSALGTGLDGPDADALAIDAGGRVYAAGRFTQAGGNPASRVAMWNGFAWSNLANPSSLSDGVDSNAYGLAVYGNDVIVAGGFSHAGGYAAGRLARYNTTDQQWYAPGNSVNGPVYAVAIQGTDVYVGGDFTSAGGIAASGIARWSTTDQNWNVVSFDQLSGCNGFLCSGPVVYALAVNGADVYVGGNFSHAGSTVVNNVVRLNGFSWHAMDGGVTNCNGAFCTYYVYTLAADGDGVDVGGIFNNAGATTVNNVALWYSGAWHALTDTGNTYTGANGPVYALAPDGAGGVYVGGDFTTPRTNLAYFDGYDWFSGWTGPNSFVYSILLPGNDIYIGGYFTNAGGAASFIARSLNGANWTPVGNAMDNPALKLLQRGNTIYAGGTFIMNGALGVNHIAAWDMVAQSWSNVGSGADNTVYALAANPSFLYVGGTFDNAGGKPSQFFGRWGAYNIVNLPLVRK